MGEFLGGESYPTSSMGVKSLYEAPTEEPCLAYEWAEEAKDEEEVKKRRGIENYVKFISSTPEFKKELKERFSKEFKKALDEGRI